MPQASSTSHCSLPIPRTPIAHNNGAIVSANSTFSPTLITTTTSSPPIQSMSISTSTQTRPIAATISMATSTSAPQLLAFPTANTTAVPSSNNSRTTSQFQQNFPYATGIPTTTSTTTPPSSLPHMTPMTKPGFRNTTTSQTGCLHSTGHSFHTTSNSKLKDGNSQSTEHISIPGWPPTNVSFDAYGNDNTPSENHTSTLPPSIMLSHSSATLPNTQQPPLKQQNNCVAADAPTYRSLRHPPHAANLEEPGRSRALHIINKALMYRIDSAFPGSRGFHQALPTVAPYHHSAAQTPDYPPPPPLASPT